MLYKYYTNQRNLSSLNNKRLNNLYEWAIDKNKKILENQVVTSQQNSSQLVDNNKRLSNLYEWTIDKNKKDNGNTSAASTQQNSNSSIT